MRKAARAFYMTVFVIVIFTFTTNVMAKGIATVTLSVDKESFAENESVTVNVTISNNSNGSIRILKWYTPFEDVEESLFNITRDGEPVEYIGAHYKRPQPVEKDFIVLKSGESFTRTVNLAEYYDFSVSGAYVIKYDIASFDLYQNEKSRLTDKQVGSLKSEGLSIFVEGRAANRPEPEAPSAVSGSSSFNKCTTTQQSSIITARNEAAVYSSNALNYLLSNTQGARYTTWFGVYNSTRYNTVKNHFTNIKSAMDTASMTFDCGCRKKYYAYVYANQPYTIYVCSIFWQAPMTGTDSKAGTLVHETSHFTVVAGTDDWVYGQAGAKNLAISDPAKAIDNADTHEYFAENTPFQP